ncbi:UDP-glycosyltransferase 91A1-like protein [Corchorus olitorius]|uniref:UDP-glycosyltransferase 91A1-like protein n=1 Tax=Corchorus olitorius TaxID=93759 RepID=A0A1R3JZS5_9ROSI|nr:UDP-glycosyltransferase 91A1-like protein [Corchorus olitorius]
MVCLGSPGTLLSTLIALAKAGVKVSLISSYPKKHSKTPLSSNFGNLDLVVLPFPALDKQLLPEGAEATVVVL